MSNKIVVTECVAVAKYLIDYDLTTEQTPVVADPTEDDIHGRWIITTRRLPLDLLALAMGVLEIEVSPGATAPTLNEMRAVVDDPQWHCVSQCRGPEYSLGQALLAGMKGDDEC